MSTTDSEMHSEPSTDLLDGELRELISAISSNVVALEARGTGGSTG